jgi:hypothetical protein
VKNDSLYCCPPANVKITLPQKFDYYVEISEFRQNIWPCGELILVTVFSYIYTHMYIYMYVCVCVSLNIINSNKIMNIINESHYID